MSIFQQVAPQPPKAIDVSEQIRGQLGQLLETEYQSQANLFHLFWHQTECTPQEICNALGDKAGQLFQLAQAQLQYLATVSQITGEPFRLEPQQYEAKKPYTINTDGTVTIGE